jgi:hypothetical protein
VDWRAPGLLGPLVGLRKSVPLKSGDSTFSTRQSYGHVVLVIWRHRRIIRPCTKPLLASAVGGSFRRNQRTCKTRETQVRCLVGKRYQTMTADYRLFSMPHGTKSSWVSSALVRHPKTRPLASESSSRSSAFTNACRKRIQRPAHSLAVILRWSLVPTQCHPVANWTLVQHFLSCTSDSRLDRACRPTCAPPDLS